MMTTDSTDTLPLANSPEVFGLHPNAEINYYSQATRDIWNHLIELQPQTGECKFFSFPFLLRAISMLKIFCFDHKWNGSLRRNGDENEKKCFN